MARALLIAPKSARRGDVVEVRALIAHPMETGLRSDGEGRTVPRNIITRIECHHDGELVFAADLGTAIAANPLFSFFVVATSSGPLSVRWSGDQGFEHSESVMLTVE